ncbi:hypothetical protein [Halorubrum trueperi]|uniref:DUF2150 family protein n=1 Tax=Halorubrum trueperi TaxID=2004704 RepID=A0ABD5UQH7_9EURY
MSDRLGDRVKLLSEEDTKYLRNKSPVDGIDRDRERRLLRDYIDIITEFATVFDYVDQGILNEAIVDSSESNAVLDSLEANLAIMYLILKEGTSDQIEVFEDAVLIAENIDTVFDESVDISISMMIDRTYHDVELGEVIDEFYSGDLFEFVELLLHQGFASLGEFGMREDIVSITLSKDFPGTAYDIVEYIDQRDNFNDEKDVIFNPVSQREVELQFEDRY